MHGQKEYGVLIRPEIIIMSVNFIKKKNIVLIASLAVIVAGVTALALYTEQHKALPDERAASSPVSTVRESNSQIITNVQKTVEVEFLVYRIVEDSDIDSQTEYKAENFRSGELPDPQYTESVTDWESLKKECPDFESEQKKAAKSGEDAVIAFHEKYRPFVEKYTKEIHPKTRYIFFDCKVKNISGEDDTECYLNEISVCSYSDNYSKSTFCTDCICYFDKSRNTEGEDREHSFFKVDLNKDETIECTLGFEIKENYGPEGHDYFFYVPMNIEAYNPKDSGNAVCLDDIKKYES